MLVHLRTLVASN